MSGVLPGQIYKRIIMKKSLKRIIGVILAAALSVASLGSCSEDAKRTASIINSPVRINEVMGSNSSVITDCDGNYSDWIEIYNPSRETVNLKGYCLSDNDQKPKKWSFPEVTISPNGYLLVFCTGEDKIVGNEIHTSFKVSSLGETLLFSDAGGRLLSTFYYPACPQNVSAGIADEDEEQVVVFYSEPTPNAPNSDEYFHDLGDIQQASYSIIINEYSTANNYYFYDSDGDCPDWVELYNTGDEEIALSGMYLSDNTLKNDKWKFPDGVSIAPKGYLLVLLSGKDKPFDGKELHADFGIGRDDASIVLSDGNKNLITSVDLVALKNNVSYGRTPDGSETWKYFARPTPGKANDSTAYDNLEASTALELRGIWISEVCAVSSSRKEVSDYSNDWIELYNGSGSDIDLTGYGLSDSNADRFKYTFEDITISDGEYLLLAAGGEVVSRSDSDDADIFSSALQTPFKISNLGETLYLTTPDGFLVDSFMTGRQQNGISSGRAGTQSDERRFFSNPTPGKQNTNGFSEYAPLPVFSNDNTYISSGDEIELSVPYGDFTIRYTTDGTEPTASSAAYSGPIKLNKSATIRAACFADGAISGGSVTRTFITEEKHDIPVICLSTDPENLFNYNKGIFADGPGKSSEFPYQGANFWKDWERPVHFEYYETDGKLGVDFNAGIRVFGQYSRAIDQKSVSIHLREAYGQNAVIYPFFKDNDVTEYHDLLLRTSGQDYNLSKLRDAFFHRVVKGQMDLDIMDCQPVAVYINGEYWGLYNLRDKENEDYLYTHHGTNPDDVNIIKANAKVLAGTNAEYKELLEYVSSHNMSSDECYQYVCDRVDVDELINYWIVETFFCNTDTGNIKFWRGNEEGDKWRWLLFDLDWGLNGSTYHWNMIEEAFNPRGHGVGKMFSTTLMCGLKKNKNFRDKFVETYAKYLQTVFAPERTTAILHEMADEIRSEIPRQNQRWQAPGLETWENQINFLDKALTQRVEWSKEHLQDFFNLSNERMHELFPND